MKKKEEKKRIKIPETADSPLFPAPFARPDACPVSNGSDSSRSPGRRSPHEGQWLEVIPFFRVYPLNRTKGKSEMDKEVSKGKPNRCGCSLLPKSLTNRRDRKRTLGLFHQSPGSRSTSFDYSLSFYSILWSTKQIDRIFFIFYVFYFFYFLRGKEGELHK